MDAFLTALRGGDFEGLLAVLDPEVLVRLDETSVRPGASREIRGARSWAKGAIAFAQAARFMQPALLDGAAAWFGRQVGGSCGSSASQLREGRLSRSK